jgi:chorismate mutase
MMTINHCCHDIDEIDGQLLQLLNVRRGQAVKP